MENKPSYLSKTVWLNVIVAVVGILSMFGIMPSLQAAVQAHTDMILAGLGVVGVALRLVTKGAVDLW